MVERFDVGLAIDFVIDLREDPLRTGPFQNLFTVFMAHGDAFGLHESNFVGHDIPFVGFSL